MGAEDEDDEYEAENSDDDGKSSKPQRSQRKGRKKAQADDEGSDIEDEAVSEVLSVE